MGNCIVDPNSRKAARSSLNLNGQASSRAPLVFQIKTWPFMNSINLQDTENCNERSIDAYLCEGECIQIDLKTAKGQLNPAANILNFNIRCLITKKNKCYNIRFPFEEERKYLWRFVGKWIDLQEGNIIRMGKTKYRLSKLIHEKQEDLQQSIRRLDDSRSLVPDHQEANRCRICLSTSNTCTNPLISPCSCLGSVKYAHLRCLNNWLFDLNVEENQYIRIRVNKSICELCKTDITGTPEYQKMTSFLLGDANNIPAPYAIFEVFQKEEQRDRSYFILPFHSKSTYTFGRSNRADVCDPNDKCISKFNSEMTYKQKRLLIKDCESTHGTFMKINGDIKLYASNQQQVIAYRNMIITARYMPHLETQ